MQKNRFSGRMREVWQAGEIPLMVDPAGDCMIELSAQGKVAALVDAILAKRNLGTSRNMAPLTIGLGPGFFPAHF